jgi:hypothetical protein
MWTKGRGRTHEAARLPRRRNSFTLYYDDEVNEGPIMVEITFQFGSDGRGADVVDVRFDGQPLGTEAAQMLYDLFNNIEPPPYPASGPTLMGAVINATLCVGKKRVVGPVDIHLQDNVDVAFNGLRLGREAANTLFDVFTDAAERAYFAEHGRRPGRD